MRTSTIVWFRQDLRLDDQPALHAAQSDDVIPVYLWDPAEEGDWPMGAASRWWLHHSLQQLDEQLRAVGSRLIIRQGKALSVLTELVRETGATSVYWTRRYEPAAIERDKLVKSGLRQHGIQAESYNGQLLFEPWEIQTNEGRPYQVFTAFWKSCLNRQEPAEPEPAPRKLNSPATWPQSLSIDGLKLLPKISWDSGFAEVWAPGSQSASRKLKSFLKSSIDDYCERRDLPAQIGTSRLSPHLHFGEISPRTIWHEIKRFAHPHKSAQAPAGAETYLKELGWREFAHHLMFHFPHTAKEPLRDDFFRFPWVRDAKGLKAWQQGKTGYPIVDAGMRELWTTGWMHNRVRMIVASFLVKDLLIPWQRGAEWFWDTLVDADLANNSLGWQWSAGCGADAAPYFRVFNPGLQSEKFDANGDYIRKWVPELEQIPSKWIHEPWKAPDEVLEKAKVCLGKSYPRPLVDHQRARENALAAFEQIKSSPTPTSKRSKGK
jgi:deoxyribodipyrimidine photo-lyase